MGHFNYDDDYSAMEEHSMAENLYNKCLAIATKAHKGQYRKWEQSNLEYITHPIAVSKNERLKDNEVAQAAALLHDVIEDNRSISAEDLLAEGVPSEIVEIVNILTRDKSEPYSKYIIDIINSKNINAMNIKLADLEHNLLSIKPGSLKDKYELSFILINTFLDIYEGNFNKCIETL